VTSARERTVESTFSHAHLASGPPENRNGAIQQNAALYEPSSTSRAAATEAQQLGWKCVNQEQCPGHSRQTGKRPTRYDATDASR
jgi:hypothetical protein